MQTLRIIFVILITGAAIQSHGQILDRLGKKAKKSAERTVERRVERETAEKTDKALDEVFEADKKSKENQDENSDTQKNEATGGSSTSANKQNTPSINGASSGSSDIASGSTFFPNGDLVFEETFQQDAQGDFPANWETTSGGEIILVDNKKALRFYPNSLCMANTGELPPNYALEFDFTTANLAYQGLSGSEFRVQFTNENKLNKDIRQRSEFHFSLWQGSSTADRIHVQNYDADNPITNNINYKMNDKFNKTAHFTLVVNGKRLRVYIDNEKVIDLPSFLQNNVGRYVQFYLRGTEPDRNHIAAISNIKITEEGEDIRSLILKGGFSTTKILFDTGSDQLKSDSYSFLNKVGKTLESDAALKVIIIGHTDSDGDSKANLSLSQKRAASVKAYLMNNFNIAESNLQTDGKGESEPVADNSAADGKAKNRRVEFKKQ